MDKEASYIVTDSFIRELMGRAVRVGIAVATKNILLSEREATRNYGSVFKELKTKGLIRPIQKITGKSMRYYRAAEIEALILSNLDKPVIG